MAITMDLPGTTAVELTIHDVAGRRVRTLVDGILGPGNHGAQWDGRSGSGEALANGVYYLRLMHSGGGVETRAVTILR
jgi:flagellar hook assembly protein FlgD